MSAIQPPTAAERTAPDMEKFVVFWSAGASVSQDDPATAWEYEPERGGGLVKRVEFTATPWAPRPLFASATGLILLQIPDAASGYVHRIFHIDYRTWQVRPVATAPRLHGLGAGDRYLYVGTVDGVQLLDRRTLELRTPEDPFRIIARLDRLWLVKPTGQGAESDAAGLFDPASNRWLRRFHLPPEWEDHHRFFASPDSRVLVVLHGHHGVDLANLRWGSPPIVSTTTLWMLDLATGELRSAPIRLLCSAGSGLPVIVRPLRIEFEDGGSRLRFLSYRAQPSATDPTQPGENVLEWVTVDPRTGRELAREAADEGPPRKVFRQDAPAIPRFLEQAASQLEHVSGEGGRRLAHAFLHAQGLDYQIPEAVIETEVGFSADGRRFLLKMTGREAAYDRFFYGDLGSRELRQIPAPEALRRGFSRIHWIRVR